MWRSRLGVRNIHGNDLDRKSFGGTQGIYRHKSGTCQCDMTFSVFLPPQAEHGPVPVLWYLSGLTCTHQNVMDKGEYRQMAAELGIAVICPDTSPRGDNIPDEADNWQFGKGAGFMSMPHRLRSRKTTGCIVTSRGN